MTSITSGTIPPAVLQNNQTTSAQALTPPQGAAVAVPKSQTNSYGNAAEVDLSPPAQAALANSSTSSTPISGKQQTTPPVATAATDVASLISAAKRKVIPQVGAGAAGDVVDAKGNISKVALAKEIAEQAQKTSNG